MNQKVAYITGGMGGIGTTMCQRLHRDGFTVIAGCGPSRDHAKWLGEQAALGYTFFASVGNVGDWDSTVAAFEKVKAEHGPVDVLVNNAGITRDGMFRKMSRADWDAVIETNLTSLFNVTKQVIDDMVDRNWGRIINISSVNGEKGQFGQTNYTATSRPTWSRRSARTFSTRSSPAFRCVAWARRATSRRWCRGWRRMSRASRPGPTSRSTAACTWAKRGCRR